MIRRQKVFKGGGSPSLSVDCIGGDRADSGGATPRSARTNGYGGGSSSVGGMSFGGGGGGTNCTDDDMGQPLTPVDLAVGRQVLLMKRPMTVCGWDETAHVWWESLTGERSSPEKRRPTGGGARSILLLLLEGASSIPKQPHSRNPRDSSVD